MPSGSAGLLMLGAAMACVLSSSMGDDSSDQQKLIQHSVSPCDGEQAFLLQRKQVAADALSKLGITCSEEEVPHIALLGSGGGQRAAVSMMGSLFQISQEGLLDAVLYVAGVSGSTWTMASLYSDPRWSSHMDTHVNSLLNGQVDQEAVLEWINETSYRDDFSLTNVWGALTAGTIMKQWDTRKLSEEAHRNATNPYPVYGACEKNCFNSGPVQGKWFEMSPHEAGFPELELFVETPFLGSEFKKGVLVEQNPEMDMIQLQGILGSALANVGMTDVMSSLNLRSDLDKETEEYLATHSSLNRFINMVKMRVTDNVTVTHMDNVQTAINEKVNENDQHLRSGSTFSRILQIKQWMDDLMTVVHEMTDNLPDGALKSQLPSLIPKLLPLIKKWEWGTVKNFLYEYEEEAIPECLASTEALHLMDGGLMINVGYPSFLGPKRDIDLLIVTDYSAGDPFETLKLARDYAAKVQKPFPSLDDQVLQQEMDFPKPCYVFEGNDTTPTVVFMPLFNRNNSRDSEVLKKNMEEYATFQKGYSPDMIEHLLETAKENLTNCKDVLVTEMGKALQRRRDKISQSKQ